MKGYTRPLPTPGDVSGPNHGLNQITSKSLQTSGNKSSNNSKVNIMRYWSIIAKFGFFLQNKTACIELLNAALSGDSRMKKKGGALRGQGKSRGGNINVYIAW